MAVKSITKAEANKLTKKASDATKMKEELVTLQFNSKKAVTNLKGGEMLTFVSQKEYVDKKTNEVSTIMVKYRNEEGAGFFSISVRDLLNKLTVGDDGATVAETLTFTKEGAWHIPAVIYVKSVTEFEEKHQTYPITAYKKYSPAVFSVDADELAGKIEQIKDSGLKPNQQPFLDKIQVELDVSKMPW